MKILSVFVLLLTPVVHAAEALRETAVQPPPRWENNAELSALITSGNTKVTTIGAGAASTFRPGEWTVKGTANYLSSNSSGTQTAEAYNGELRGERKITESLSGFLNGTYLKNRFAGFLRRFGEEGGLSYAMLRTDWHVLTSEVGLGFLQERRTDFTRRDFATGRLGLEYRWKLSETADFSNNLSVLDNFRTTKDWRLSNVAAITAVLTEVLSLKVSYRIDFLNMPVTGKKNTDTATQVALVAKF